MVVLAVRNRQVDSVTVDGSDDERLHAILRDFGLPTAEAAVFSTLLRLGSKQASAIAKYSGISRAHVYGLLDKLQERGFISMHDRDGIRVFTAVPLPQLVECLAARESLLISRRKQLEDLLPRYRTPEREYFSDPVTRGMQGAEVRAQLFRELFSSNDEQKYLFCSVDQSSLFEEQRIDAEVLSPLLSMSRVRIVLYSDDGLAEQLAAEVNDSKVSFFCGELPVECVVSRSSIKIFGRKGASCKAIALEQRAFAETMYCLAERLFG